MTNSIMHYLTLYVELTFDKRISLLRQRFDNHSNID